MVKINLLPKEARKRVGIGEKIAVIIIGLVIIFGGIGFYWSYLDGVIEQKQKDIADTKKRLAELQRIIKEIEQFEKQRAALEKKLEIIATLQREQQVPVHMLDEVYLTLEDDVWLKTFRQTSQNNQLDFTGSALSNPVLASYLRNLQDSPYFSNVQLVVSRVRPAGSQEVRDFQIKAVLTPPQTKEEPEEESTQ